MQNNSMFYSMNSFDALKDEEIISLIRNGDKHALEYMLEKYKDLVNYRVSRFFMVGAEKEDVFQEGMIGLYKAIKDFDPEKQNSFKTFAGLCVERQLITAIKSSNRQKHMPLNLSMSLNSHASDEEDDSDDELINIFYNKSAEDPLETITKKEYYREVEEIMQKSLSDFEKKVLHRFINGESYISIAEKLDSNVKSVDNAIQRIRKKGIQNIEL